MTDAPDPPRHKLTRDFLLDARFADMIRAAMSEAVILSDAERAASVRAMLDSRPEHGDGLWPFSYGSLTTHAVMSHGTPGQTPHYATLMRATLASVFRATLATTRPGASSLRTSTTIC